jgi:hypothetical protein
MKEQQRPWQLPEGVKFYVYPRYLLVVEGIEVKLTPMQARIVLFLMSHPGRRFHSNEIMNTIFEDREDGGGSHKSYVPSMIGGILNRCRKVGIELCLKMPGAFLGYAFMGVSLTDRGRAEASRRASLPIHNPESPTYPAKFRKMRTPRPQPMANKERMKGHPYINVFDGTGGWTFPLRIEQDQWRRMKVGVK